MIKSKFYKIASLFVSVAMLTSIIPHATIIAKAQSHNKTEIIPTQAIYPSR